MVNVYWSKVSVSVISQCHQSVSVSVSSVSVSVISQCSEFCVQSSINHSTSKNHRVGFVINHAELSGSDT